MRYSAVLQSGFQSSLPFASHRNSQLTFNSGTTLEMDKGHISLVPYYIVENLVARGEVELV